MTGGGTLGVGLVGAGFMGRCHANAFRNVCRIFDIPFEIDLRLLADIDAEAAARNAAALGFARWTDDWRVLTASSDVDILAITAPNALHEPIALDAIAHGKAVYCEKPLATDKAAAMRMTAAAESRGTPTMVGFNFLSNPMIACAADMIAGGEIGTVTGFRGRHAENYMADPAIPHSFRTDPAGGGALADIGSHIVAMAHYLVGPVREAFGELTTIIPERPEKAGSERRLPVLVDDCAHAILRFENGTVGAFEANWAATGRTMDLSFEITGTEGAIRFSQERMNELHVWRPCGRRSGYTKIEAGPEHPPYGRFCPAPGHQIGFNDMKIIEVSRFLEAIASGTPAYPGFRDALRIQHVIDGIRYSANAGCWVPIEGSA